ncbi:MAG: transposase [Candidatus Syntrophoarchaeum sp.]|nr:transposase [Candidatus Syntrophoarchaeum sp.]
MIRGEEYDDFIPLFTTALNSKPETVISKYRERSSIEQVIKELKSYLKIEGNYFRTKESNYGFIFLACVVYNFVQYMSTQLPDTSFKDVLDSVSAYLMWANPPECVFALGETFEELLINIGYEVPNRTNTELMGITTQAGEVDT